jgi:selenocysteine lyase/cysteine desulfurase
MADWRVGAAPWTVWDESTGRARECFGRLVGAPAGDIFVGSTVAAAIAPIAAALPRGARVLVDEVEFTSNVFPWKVHADRDIEVVTALSDGLLEAIRPGIDLVAVSAVQSSNGSVLDLASVVAAAETADALLVVDASQAAGWLPLDVSGIDALVAHGYKWLTSPRGATVGYLSPRLQERCRPLHASWYAAADPFSSFYGTQMHLAPGARRFDQSPAWFSFVGLAPALELLEEIGIDAIQAHNLALANQFRAGLGLPPSDSAIVSVTVPGADEALARAGVRADVRDGRVRAAFHVYSTETDVRLALDALRGLDTAH